MAYEQLVTAFTFGILASGNPCALPLYPGFVAYLANRSNRMNVRRTEALMGLIVVLGLLASMLVFGAVAIRLRVSFLRFLTVIDPVVNLILLAFGIILVLNLKISTPVLSPRIPPLRNPVAEAFAYGFLYGPVAIPCNLPLVLSIVAFSFTVFDAFSRLLVFILFGIGLGLPLIVLSMVAKAKRGMIVRELAKRHSLVSRVAGALLILVALYGLVYLPAYLSGFL